MGNTHNISFYNFCHDLLRDSDYNTSCDCSKVQLQLDFTKLTEQRKDKFWLAIIYQSTV